MKNVQCIDKTFCIFGSSLKTKHDFFTEPLKFSFLDIYLNIYNTFNPLKLDNITQIKCKMVSMIYNTNDSVYIPLYIPFTKCI